MGGCWMVGAGGLIGVSVSIRQLMIDDDVCDQ